MRILMTLSVAILLQPAIASAQELSEQMSCEQAVAYFEEHGSINTGVSGTVLSITQGVPIRKAELLECGGGENRFDTMVKTRDKEQCVIAAYCE